MKPCANRLPTPKHRAISNPNVSDEAKVAAEKRLEELEAQQAKDPGHVAAGLKAYVTYSSEHI